MKYNKLFNIEDKVIVITGGSGFLGSHYGQFFSELGARVINLDLQSKPRIDITDEAEVREFIFLAIRKYKKIDVLINNASLNLHIDKKLSKEKSKNIDFFAEVEQYPLEAFKRGLSIDLVGSFIVSKTVLPFMKKQGKGVIINISSIYGMIAPDQRIYKGIKNPFKLKKDIVKPIYYSVSKAGMWGLTSYLASYSAPEVRVNQLTLGGIQYNETKEFIKRYASKTMLGRMGKVEDIYGALLFLSTDASSYMTGANIVLDGGMSVW